MNFKKGSFMKKAYAFFSLALVIVSMTTFNFVFSTPSDESLQGVVLAAGEGSRLKTGVTKMITPICGQPMVVYALKLMQELNIPATAVIGFQKDKVKAAIDQAHIPHVQFAEQIQQLGTGHALLASKSTWQASTLIVTNGDMPLVSAEIIRRLVDEHFKRNAAITVATSYNVDPANTFGRIVTQGNIVKIVEKKHFTYDIKDYPYVNAGIYIINREFLEKYASYIQQNSVTKEFYITDLVEIASTNGLPVATLAFPFDLMHGVNTFQELSQAEQIKRDELIHHWMARGVRFIAPATNQIDFNVTIGRGTVISAGVQLLHGTSIGEFCTLHPHAVLCNARIEDNASVGAQSVIENSTVAKGSSVKPFSYIRG